MNRQTSIAAILLIACPALFAVAQQEPTAAKPPIACRTVHVPLSPRLEFKSQVIGSADELAAFIKEVLPKDAVKSQGDFVKALQNAKIDFTKEALVLIQHTTGVWARVSLATPELIGSTLICEVQHSHTKDVLLSRGGFCFALVVNKAVVKRVEIYLEGAKTYEFAEILHVDAAPEGPAKQAKPIDQRVAELEAKVAELTKELVRARREGPDAKNARPRVIDSEFNIYFLKNCKAADMAKIVKDLLPEQDGIRFAVEPDTNALLVRANVEALTIIEAIINRLEDYGGPRKGK